MCCQWSISCVRLLCESTGRGACVAYHGHLLTTRYDLDHTIMLVHHSLLMHRVKDQELQRTVSHVLDHNLVALRKRSIVGHDILPELCVVAEECVDHD